MYMYVYTQVIGSVSSAQCIIIHSQLNCGVLAGTVAQQCCARMVVRVRRSESE